VIRGLEQPDPRDSAPARSIEGSQHELPADARILHVRVNRDRSQPRYRRPLVEEVASDDTAPELGHDGIKAWMPEQTRKELGGLLRRRKIGREAVALGERAECFVAYVATRLRVGGRSRA
jgi:hypothetical protein